MDEHRPHRSPGRPTAPESVDRMALLEAAVDLIAARGFANTTIRAVAAAVGVTHGTVQHHFPSKDALWEALVDEVIVPRMRDAAPATVAAADDLLDAVRAGMRARLAHGLDRPGLTGAILVDGADGAQARLTYLAEASRPVRQDRLALLQQLIDVGAIRPVSPTAAAAIIGLMTAMMTSATTALRLLFDVDLNDQADKDRFIDDVADIILNGLLPRDDQEARHHADS
jgi:AcrR family transcriptional regulator